MPPPSAAQQKVLIAQFVALTGQSERQATRYLKNSGFKLNEAVDAFFSSNGDTKGPSPLENKLESSFTDLQDTGDEKDKLELESTMSYLQNKLKVNIENAELLVALELVQAPSVGVINRRGYVDGWKVTGVGATHQEHAAHIRRLVKSLSSDQALFKKVYRHTFIAGREPDQKALGIETALVYWDILFAAPGIEWKTSKHDWLALWKEFLAEKWKNSVNKDMWNMTLEFALKSLSDESLSFWNEDGAWPSVIDNFVEWCRGKNIGKTDGMDVDN
ncbi:hypothetical protein ACHAPU_009016 [Fusarium lateritium]